MELHAAAERADMFVEGGLEPAVAQRAALQPLRSQCAHFGEHGTRVNIRCAEQLERPGRAPPFGQSRAFQQHGAGISARHR